MRYVRSTIGAVAALTVLVACGSGDEVPDPVTSPSTAATTSAPQTAAPASPAPTGSSPSAAASGSPSAALTLVESCRAVLDDQQAAVTTLRTYVRNPLAADVEDLDRLRSELLAGERSAPEPLRQELNTQVGVLTSVVQGIQDGNVQRVDIDAFQDARNRIVALCEDAR